MDDANQDPAQELLDPDDPFIQAAVEMAVARYQGRMSLDMLDEHKRMLAVLLSTHPSASALVRRAKAQAAAGSGVVARRGARKTGSR